MGKARYSRAIWDDVCAHSTADEGDRETGPNRGPSREMRPVVSRIIAPERWSDNPGLSGLVQYNHKSPSKWKQAAEQNQCQSDAV